MGKFRAGFTVFAVSTLILLSTFSIARADIPSWFWASLFNWADGVTAEVDAVEALVADQQAQIDALTAQIETLQANSVLDLDGALVMDTLNGNPVARFQGINVQVFNGTGNTYFIKDLGNLFVGYDEPDPTPPPDFCDDGDQKGDECGDNYDVYKGGSHNVVIGRNHSYTQHSGLVVGEGNVINNRGSVSFGQSNRASGRWSAITGGGNNVIEGDNDNISAGDSNYADGPYATVSGGRNNHADGDWSSISGGGFSDSAFGNRASAAYSSVSGGFNNRAEASWSSISGGSTNTTEGDYASIGGGFNNSALGGWSSISGGSGNSANAVNSVVSGGFGRTAPNDNDWVAGALFQDF
jgi:hypothetical protein